MITYTEHLIALPEVPDYIASRGIIRPNACAVYRWARVGCHGARLETQLIANRMYTSKEALDRFFTASAGKAVAAAKPKSRGMTREEAEALCS